MLLRLFAISAFFCGQIGAQSLLPANWDPALAGDIVMQRLINTSAPQVKGAHDAEFVCVGERAYLVAEANDVKAGESAGWPFIYATMSIVNLKTLTLERVIDFAKSEQALKTRRCPSARVLCRASFKKTPARCAATSPAKIRASGSRRCGIATSM
jgi:hypothetical protein